MKEKNNFKTCANIETCPVRKEYLGKMPWLDYYCKQYPEKCNRKQLSQQGIDFPGAMLPDGTEDICRVNRNEEKDEE